MQQQKKLFVFTTPDLEWNLWLWAHRTVARRSVVEHSQINRRDLSIYPGF